MYTLTQITGAKIAVWCRTEEEAVKFLKQLESLGLMWRSGNKPTDKDVASESVKFYESELCINIDGESASSATISYANREFYTDLGYTIITPADLTEENQSWRNHTNAPEEEFPAHADTSYTMD